VKRINMLTRNLLMQKEDIGESVEKVKAKVMSLCAKIKKAENANKYAEILIRQLFRLHTAYDDAKEVALGEFNKERKSRRRGRLCVRGILRNVEEVGGKLN